MLEMKRKKKSQDFLFVDYVYGEFPTPFPTDLHKYIASLEIIKTHTFFCIGWRNTEFSKADF